MKGVIWTCDRFGDGIEKLQYIRDRYIWSGVNVVREVYSQRSCKRRGQGSACHTHRCLCS